MEQNMFIRILNSEMELATGCTEPGAVALTAAEAGQALRKAGVDKAEEITVNASINIIKNAMSAGIPGTDYEGMDYAAAIGALGGDPVYLLEVMNHVPRETVEAAAALVKAGKVRVNVAQVPQKLYIEVIAKGGGHTGRAIVRDPAVFLMDEPLSNLDAKLRNQMRAEIIKLRQRINTTFIYVTHDQTEAMTLGDRIVIMRDGFIQQIGTPQEVFDHPANLFVAGFIGTPQMNLFDGKLIKQDGKYAVTVENITVVLSDDKQKRLSDKNVPEQDIVLGVRPDHIMLCADGIKGKVDVSELMGSSVHLHVSAEGKDVVVIVPTNGNAAHFPMGSEVNMIFGGNVAHVFSKETEQNLEW